MTRRKWLWSALLAVPLAVGGGLVYAHSQAGGFICPITGERLTCGWCCPLNGATSQSQNEGAFICPLTGEELPCEKCCPLNQEK